jgi:hypothetical protein
LENGGFAEKDTKKSRKKLLYGMVKGKETSTGDEREHSIDALWLLMMSMADCCCLVLLG